MRIIDAFSGRNVHVGDVVPSPGGEHDWELVDVDERGFFDVHICTREVLSGRVNWWPLTVRVLHPNFMFRRVGFVAT